MRRREFLVHAAVGGAGVLGADALRAQQGPDGPARATSSNLFSMNQGAFRTVHRPPKHGAVAFLSADQRDALEREIRCQCGCTLDVYICRTTDFSCQVSPAMHGDIMSLVNGGYAAQEILDAFVGIYGEKALMTPRREGFNWAGYVVPFAALAAGGVAITVVLRRMQRKSGVTSAQSAAVAAALPPTPDELARLNAAIRRNE